LALEQEREIRQEEEKIKRGKVGSSNYSRIPCRYQFSYVFSLLCLACMVLHVVAFFHGIGFTRCDIIFSLAFPFPDNLDEMGYHTSVQLDFQMNSRLSEVYL